MWILIFMCLMSTLKKKGEDKKVLQYDNAFGITQ